MIEKFKKGKIHAVIKQLSDNTADLSLISEIDSTILNLKKLEFSKEKFTEFFKYSTDNDNVKFMIYHPGIPPFPVLPDYDSESGFEGMHLATIILQPSGT